jgi:hypothetical protein
MARFALRLAPLLLVAPLVLFGARDAVAGPKEDLEKAELLYGNLSYDEANKLAVSVTRQKGLTHDQLVRAYRIAAITHAILDREDPARDAFVMLLTYEADSQADPNLGPKVTTPFFEARGFWRGQPVKPGIDATATLKAKEPGTFKVTVRDPSHIVKRAQSGWRFGPTGEFKVRPITPGDPVTIDIPAPPANVTRFDYYVQAFDEKDNVVLETGNDKQPKTTTIEVPAPVVVAGPTGPGTEKKSGGIFSSGVFWGVLAGAAAIGGGTAIFFATRPSQEAGSASFAPSLNCGGARCN